MINPGTPTFNLGRVDEIRKQIQEAKDALCSEIMIRSDRGAFAPLINKLVGDIRSLEVMLAESERVILKPAPSYDSLKQGQEYYVRFKRGMEMIVSEFYSASDDGSVRSRAINVSDLDQIFIPVE